MEIDGENGEINFFIKKEIESELKSIYKICKWIRTIFSFRIARCRKLLIYMGRNTMNKRKIRKILSFIVTLVLIVGNCVTVHAANNNYSSEDTLLIYNDGETVVKGYEDSAGNMIFTQYVRGVLVQKNTIAPNDPETINREFFGGAITRGLSKDTININEYGILNKSTATTQSISAKTLAGTINYRAIIDTGYTYYGLRCSYDTRVIGPTTYTINGYVGTVVDLVSIIAGAFTIPIPIVGPYVAALISGLGITVVSGVIESALSDTVSCIETDYTWTLTDTTNSGHSKNVTGAKYFITDTKSAAKDKTYYEGYTPNDWGTQAMAVWFHNEMFSYSAWDVVSWS